MAARICCLDLDTFFVSVERLFDPALVGKPVVVGGRRGSRGVVTAASYEVREFGVRSGMSMRDASRLAPPDAVFVPTRHGAYGDYSKRVRAVLERFSPEVRAASIDEFYIDFGGCEGLYRRSEGECGDAIIERTVRQMCRIILDETGLPASAGIGGSRIVAKIASGRAKPAGVLLVPVGSERDFLLPLPVRKFPGIGPKAEARMVADGLHTLGDLTCLPTGPLRLRYARNLAVLERELSGQPRTTPLGRERPAFSEHDPSGLRVEAFPTSAPSSTTSAATRSPSRSYCGSRSACAFVLDGAGSGRAPSRSSCARRIFTPSTVRAPWSPPPTKPR